MKQRLLLALLMLFSSVGFMKAQKTIDISVPKGDGTVTVTMTSDKFSFKEDNYPTYVPNNAVSHKFGTKSVIYTIKQNKDNPVKFEIITKANAWGNLSIKLDGKVTSFDAGEETPLSKLVTSLEFVENGVLSVFKFG